MLHSSTKSHQATIRIHPKSSQRAAIVDLQTMFKIIGACPTKCTQLIPGKPAFIGHTDACKFGARGILTSGTKSIHPVVWHVKWPQDIVD